MDRKPDKALGSAQAERRIAEREACYTRGFTTLLRLVLQTRGAAAMTLENCANPRGDALLIFTRDPRGRATGRKLVLRTILRSVTDLGWRATVAHFGRSEGAETENCVRFVALQGPRPHELVVGATGWLLHRKPSLNEVLYASARARRQLAALSAESGADFAITDMVRTACYGAASGLPWIADLDDLLSRRYALAARAGGGIGDLLGYHRSPVLRALLPLLSPVRAAFLRREAAAVATSEIAVARAADVTSLVSAAEADALCATSGVPVRCLPMAVEEPPMAATRATRGRGLVFVGPMDYAPNREAVRRYDAEVAPALRAAGLGDGTLHVIGATDEAARRGFSKAIVFLGFVEDLDATLRGFEAMLVPPVAPGGVKTKVIHAALNRLPILAHSSAVADSGMEHGREALVWSDVGELAAALAALRQGRVDREAMTANALEWARARFSPAGIRRRWADCIAAALDARGLEHGDRRDAHPAGGGL